jgi:uncharacterized protein
MSITASKLFSYIQCPHRVWRDEHGPQDEKNTDPNPFVEMLWEKGVQHEREVVAGIGSYTDVSQGDLVSRARDTIAAMKRGDGLIYQGVLMSGDLVGIPDLLRKVGTGEYIPMDIKSGMGLEGSEDEPGDAKLKAHYALQLCLYREALGDLGYASGPWKGVILDVRGLEVPYDLEAAQGARNKETWKERYARDKQNVRALLANEAQNLPALSPGKCKLCPWYESCKKWATAKDDLTLLFYMGRSARDRISEDLGVKTVKDLAQLNLAEALAKKDSDSEFLKGVGEKTLQSAIDRARIMKGGGGPVAYDVIKFPDVTYELFFDIEDDPTQEFVYMHGVYERSPNGERYLDFTAKDATTEEEKRAWSEFWGYVRSLPKGNFAVYYYSAHEKTTYRRMQKKYPDVVSEDELEMFFGSENTIDLYTKVVLKSTDWPLGSYSIKSLATYLGFSWRDKSPSGALSIQWFNEYLKTRDASIMSRILEYNEDDCKATMVLKDGLEKLPLAR